MYKKMILCALIFIFVFSGAAYSVEKVNGDVLVVLRPSSSEEKITVSSLNNLGSEAFRVASFAASSKAWVKNTYPALSEAENSVYALLHSDIKTPEELVQELLNNPEVLAASLNYKVYAAIVPDDLYIDECWGMDYINAPEAWDISTGSSDVYVAVIDTGIDYENPDLIDNIDFEYSKNFVSSATSAADDYGHGTHVSGTIGAVGNNGIGVAGLNWDIKLISMKALSSSGYGAVADVISAIDYAASLIKSGVNIRAVNMSLETYVNFEPTYNNLVREPLWRAMKALDEFNKTVIVVAAGNYSQVVGAPSTQRAGSMIPGAGYYVYPASFKGLNNMISVSAVSADGSIASFSNTSADIAAPGVSILSTWLQSSTSNIRADGTSLYTAQGTSMSAPHVSGAAALLASIMPDRTAYQIKNAILGRTSSSVVSAAAADKFLDVSAAIAFQEENSADIAATPPASEYDNYRNYSADRSYGNSDSGGGGGGGGCNGMSAGIFAVMILFPLAKKIRS